MAKTRKKGGGRKKLPKSEKVTQIAISAKGKHIKQIGGLKEARKTAQLFWDNQFNLD